MPLFKTSQLLRIHILFWTLFIFFGVIFNVALHNKMQLNWSLFLADLTDPFTPVGYGRTILMCYFSLWVFDRLFQQRQYGLAVLALMLLVAMDVLVRYIVEQLFLGPVFDIWQYPKGIRIWDYFGENVFFSALGIFLCFLLKTINDYFRHEAMRHEKLVMELAYLKSQLNPHFLFNTMNNLYGLSLSEPERTPDVILRLGEMMRYMLYESNETFVPVNREIEYLNGFVELEKLRYPGEIFVHFTLEGNVNGIVIAPLLFIAFVENAFKHGQLRDPAFPVHISLSISGPTLRFEISNQITFQNRDTAGGIGLKNVERRLTLLYPGNHMLRVWQEADQFHTLLEINVNAVKAD
ncbi:sensor histidine kinase [Dyadobacter alkalitolerans]|uniref:sensor histidine kinase n=1 Tax=Dyadobacter alkalitolerans TaxID=492736 RepID=UPI000688E086|nr:histidine kinase [Dyadobacter alkalitolerans]